MDLGLPDKNRQEAPPGAEPGVELVRLASLREAYPVPAVLVVSGRLGLLKTISGLQDLLSDGLWYGRLVNKGPDAIDEIERAMQRIQQYCGIGIHIQDAGTKWHPTLSPREDDMIRRCVLAQGDVGIDLRWWGAERGKSDAIDGQHNGTVKVLAGRFILDHGKGHSRTIFLKFEPAGNARHVFTNVAIMEQKLLHVKVCHTCASSTRGLLVTQCVAEGQPMALVLCPTMILG